MDKHGDRLLTGSRGSSQLRANWKLLEHLDREQHADASVPWNRQAEAYLRRHASRFVDELTAFIRIPAVSAQPDHAPDVRRCAEWLAEHLWSLGSSDVRIFPTPRHPVVYAHWVSAPTRPTVLIYGHYDVQPADPIGEWRSPPFSPEVRDGNIYGRGACDDKGQMFAHVKAIECLLQTNRRLPVNVTCIFEGEEEISSPHLQSFITANRHLLRADVAVMSDMPIAGPGQPAITYALRGSLGLELEVSGPRRDLHSGLFGGAVHNPLEALCAIIASLHDEEGRIAVKGVYDDVVHLSPEERRYLSRVSPSDTRFLRDAQAQHGWGERGYSLSERTTIRPALTINGVSGGYEGVGGKAVIPSRAAAKLSFRLVPNQDPHQIEALFRDHVASVTPRTVRAEVRAISWAQPALMEVRHPAIRAAADAYKAGFGSSPVFLRCGGTIPVVNMLLERLHLPTVLMGFALPTDQMHGPNERFNLSNFYNGIRTSASFLELVGSS